jgi:acyl carrier protein
MTADRSSRQHIKRVVCEQIVHLVERIPNNPPARSGVIHEEQSLEALGFGSLDLLELVDSLETALGVNPFEQGLSMTDVRTVGDLCGAYHRALSEGAGAPDGTDPILLASVRRGVGRRHRRTK